MGIFSGNLKSRCHGPDWSGGQAAGCAVVSSRRREFSALAAAVPINFNFLGVTFVTHLEIYQRPITAAILLMTLRDGHSLQCVQLSDPLNLPEEQPTA